MRNESGTVMSSYIMGIGVFAFGVFMEPLLMVLGGLMIVSGVAAKFVESRRLKYQAMEEQKQDSKLKEQVA